MTRAEPAAGGELPEVPLDELVTITTREGNPERAYSHGGWAHAVHTVPGLLILEFQRDAAMDEGADPDEATPHRDTASSWIEARTLARALAAHFDMPLEEAVSLIETLVFDHV